MQAALALVAVSALVAPAAPCAPWAQEGGPSKEQVEQTVQLLKEAFSKGASADRVAALLAATDVPHERVVAAVDQGLRDQDVQVQRAALESLRFLEHPAALEALHACYRRERKLIKDPERAPLLFRAIGQHASATSLEVLTDDAFGSTEAQILQARILAVANIRVPASVEALMDLINRAGGSRLQPHMDTFRLALARLTGTDRGKTLDDWQRWWNDAKRDLQVAPEPPKLSKVDQLRWDQFWGLEETRERSRRRDRRGDD